MAEAPTIAAPAPDWEALDVELRCPRCGYNLRMLTVARCPECGLAFDWNDLIAVARKQVEHGLFEFQWRQHPIRSLVITILRAMNPFRLWRTVRMVDSPRVGPLLALVPLVSASFIAASIAISLMWIAYTRFFWPGPLLQLLWQPVSPTSLLRFSISFASRYLPLLVFLWIVMQVYYRTFVKFNIRAEHILRIVVLSWIGATAWHWTLVFALSVAAHILQMAMASNYLAMPPRWLLYSLTSSTLLVLFVSCSLGLNVYLRLERGWVAGFTAIFLLSCMLLTLVLAASYYVHGEYRNPVMDVCEQWLPGFAQGVNWLVVRVLL